jgi:hypothetical protein
MTSAPAAASPPPALLAAGRAALWTALGLALAALVLPDCCVNGRHAAGFGMETYAAICHAAR